MDKSNAHTSEEFTGLKVKNPETKVAGIKAVNSALKHVNKYMRKSDGFKVLNVLNQKEGIDCPGCAWPDPDDERSALGEYCENGVKAIAEEATKRRVDAQFFKDHSVTELGTWSDFRLGKSGRLVEPMYLRQGSSHYEPISWEEAFVKIGKHLNSLNSPDEAIFYTSGRTSNEAAFLYQLFVRCFGTNNLPDCSNMCHESSGKALSQTIGIGKGTVKLHDFEKADLVIVIGQNPGTNHPRMLSALEKTKENGGKIITINPLKEAGLQTFVHPQSPIKMIKGGTRLTDVYLQNKINSDLALLQYFNKRLIEDGVIDKVFVENKTEYFDAFEKHTLNKSKEELVTYTGLSSEELEKAYQLIKEKDKIIVCWAMGLTQHKNAVNTIQEVVNLLLLKGSIGVEGGGVCPVRGHSNVQGDRTMGIWEAAPESFLAKMDEVFNMSCPRKHGYDTVNAIKAMHNGDAKVFIGMGGNFISATPDTDYTAKALTNCKLTVQVSTKLNRSHLVHGEEALILPCLGRTDIDIQNGSKQFVTCENSMGVVHTSQGILSPPSEHLLSEPRIIAEMAKTTLLNKIVDWDNLISDYDLIRDEIEKVIPGFENYNERVRKPEGFYLPNGPRHQNFTTESGRARFTLSDFEQIKIEKGEYLMMTIRSHDQFNTTIYGLDDRYRGIYNERRVILMNKLDIRDEGLSSGDIVNLMSYWNGRERKAPKFIIVEYPIPRGCVATYFPEANVLVQIDNVADMSNTPASKSIVIKMEKG